jgi:hypothetical protein
MLVRREEEEASALVVAPTAVITGLLLTWYLETDIPSPDDSNNTGKITLVQSHKQYRIAFTALQTSMLFRRAQNAPDPAGSYQLIVSKAAQSASPKGSKLTTRLPSRAPYTHVGVYTTLTLTHFSP